jgi:hypothetical protein
MYCVLTQEELNELCAEWQNTLRLNHWDIYAAITRNSDFSDEGNEGEIDYFLEKGDAAIRILDPIDYPQDTPFRQDMEQTLVHELLHLYFAPFQPNKEKDELKYAYWERAIDDLAKVLVKIKREQNGFEEDIQIEFVPEEKTKKRK